MGTTANVITIFNNTILIANAGDSLSVLFRNNKAVILNTEHKLSIKSETERVLNAGRKIINDRIDGKLNLSRALGDYQFKDKHLKPFEQAVSPIPEILSYPLDSHCEFLITACDGVWDCVDPQKLCEFISKELKENIKSISEIISNIEDMILSTTVNSPIGTDNMTCMIIQFK